jgi:MerR family transcriptional regulator/heat shock protein HspR
MNEIGQSGQVLLPDKELPVFTISAAAKILNISVHTLRMYEREGLIIPYKKSTNHRLYSHSDIERLRCIRRAINEMKISIAGIKTIQSMIPCWKIKGCTEEKRSHCQAYNSHSRPCWTYNSKSNSCSWNSCKTCEVYRNFTECSTIKECIIKFLNE